MTTFENSMTKQSGKSLSRRGLTSLDPSDGGGFPCIVEPHHDQRHFPVNSKSDENSTEVLNW